MDKKSKLLVLLLLTFLCSARDGKAQAYTTEGNDTSNVYAKAFQEFENYVEKYFPSVKELLVEESIISVTWMHPTSKNLVTRILPTSDVPSEFKKRKGIMYYTRIVPLRFEGDFFFINIIPFKINHKKNKTEFINSGALTIKFKFDCSSNQFMFSSVEGGLSDLQ